MLRTKGNTILSEISDFLTSTEKVCQTLMNIIEKLKLDRRGMIPNEDIRTRYYRGGTLTLLLLFPFMDISTVREYSLSGVHNLYRAGKDVFYRLKNNPFIDWRKIAYRITLKLLSVDIEAPEMNLSHIETGEWVQYTVEVNDAGIYLCQLNTSGTTTVNFTWKWMEKTGQAVWIFPPTGSGINGNGTPLHRFDWHSPQGYIRSGFIANSQDIMSRR